MLIIVNQTKDDSGKVCFENAVVVFPTAQSIAMMRIVAKLLLAYTEAEENNSSTSTAVLGRSVWRCKEVWGQRGKLFFLFDRQVVDQPRITNRLV
ncbi:Serine/threonine-protein kinase ATR [Trichinella spiralis]|uniref:Serine/threonine-protein kinase ATR n=1 Tax=Trichinella spiralis TaxID=6334 RepID=A0ABR3KG35_TRISP